MPNTADTWDESSPAPSGLISEGDDEIRAVRAGTSQRLEKEHVVPSASNGGGEHLQGSAKVYIADDEASLPVLRPDGATSFTVEDEGRLAITLDTGLLYYLKNVATVMTWTKITANASFSQIPEDYVLLQENRAGPSGTFTAEGWRTRPLNTEVSDAGTICTPDFGNDFRFELAAGTYRFRIVAMAHRAGVNQARLFNFTDNTPVAYGLSNTSQPVDDEGDEFDGNSHSEIVGRMTLATAKTFKIQHYCLATKTGTGFGKRSDDVIAGANSITLSAEFWREV